MARPSFLTLRSDSLSEGQKRTLLKFACAIAWADGRLVEAEQAELAKSLEELGGIRRSDLDAMLMSVKQLDDVIKEELRSLPVAEAHQVLKLGFRIANADGHIPEKELAVIREASAVLFPDKPWDLVLDWIRSHQAMTGLVDLAPDSVFADQFRVVRRLSEGGMGAVYVVEQIATGALRALKLMHPQLVADPKLRKRFEQEARVGSRIDSEHVVHVLSAGIDAQSGAPWLAMELLKGDDLAQYAERVGCLPAGEVRELFEQLCHALGAAHAAGIVHRDLKPENIFLAAAKRVGAPYIIKVLDFGIAKVASEAKTADTAAIGTPIWMAPEQSSRGQGVSPATDVWAPGLIAFRLLTGKPFWRGANDDSSSMMLLREIVLDPIPLATERAAEFGCGGRLVKGFDAWFARCVVRDQAARFPDATSAFAALEPLLPSDGALSSGGGLAGAVARASNPRLDDSHGGLDATHPAPAAERVPSEQLFAGSRTRSGPQAAIRSPTRTRWITLGAGSVVALALGIAWLTSGSRAPAPSGPAQSAALAPAVPAAIVQSAPSASTAPLAASFAEPVPVKMISVPGGAFSMGSSDGEDDERPVHAETVEPFDIDMTEVTVGAYETCVGAHACVAPQPGSECNWGVAGRADHPINCVTWQDADSYCHAVRKRLPTEREWEYAARGKAGKKWPWGAAPPLAQLCWNGKGSDLGRGNRKGTCPVSAFPGDVSSFGVLDMGGNVMEWTASRYCPYTESNCASDARVTRGCAWDELATPACGATYRDKRSEFERTVRLGFRCARTP